MNHRQGRARAATRDNRGGDYRQSTDAQKDTTATAEIPQQFDEHERATNWRYTLRGVKGTLYLVTTERINREEALKGLKQHYGDDRVLTLEPGVEP
jgi:hypothetical protein